MKKKISSFLFSLTVLLTFMAAHAQAAVVSFDDLTLAADSYWNGADGSGGFISGDAYLLNDYNATYGSWSGFAYSNTTDTTTAGSANQFSAVTGGGVNGSANYGVGYDMLNMGSYGSHSSLSFMSVDYNTTLTGAYFTNTTYSYLSMLEGDDYAAKFGEGDWFKLSISGIDENGEYTGTVDHYLADFRSDDSSLWYIDNQWSWLDLSSLGAVIGLEFALSSSDSDQYGMNTPAYFAMDDLNGAAPVPLPAAVWFFGSGLAGMVCMRRRKSETGTAGRH